MCMSVCMPYLPAQAADARLIGALIGDPERIDDCQACGAQRLACGSVDDFEAGRWKRRQDDAWPLSLAVALRLRRQWLLLLLLLPPLPLLLLVPGKRLTAPHLTPPEQTRGVGAHGHALARIGLPPLAGAPPMTVTLPVTLRVMTLRVTLPVTL